MLLTLRQVEPPIGPKCSDLSLGSRANTHEHLSTVASPFWIDVSVWRRKGQSSQLFTLNCRNSARLFFFPDCSLTWNQPEAWLHPENVLLEIQTNKFWTTCLKREGNVYIQNMKSDRKTSCGPPREFRSRPLQQISPCCRGGGRQKRQITVTW